MEPRVKRTLIGLGSVTLLTGARGWATKLGYIPNYLGIETLCPGHHVEIVPSTTSYEDYAKQWAAHPDENKDIRRNYLEDKDEEYFEDIDTGSYYFEDLETDHSGVTTTKGNSYNRDNHQSNESDSQDLNENLNNKGRVGWGNDVDLNNTKIEVAEKGSQIPMDYKPIIYLYPEKTTEVNVRLGNPTQLTHSYPRYPDAGWNVIANPDGSLIDISNNRKLYALYWEGFNNKSDDITEGFVVKGEDTISFLEEKLAILGLNEREAEEFIVYWLPELENNPWNLIRFRTLDEINEIMPLDITPTPNSVIRVLMQYKPLNTYQEISEQTLTTPGRTGFSVVEWGGEKYSIIK